VPQVPKLWDETIDAHRRGVQGAILDACAALIAERGLRAITMSEIAERTGIARATLYKYFSGVEPILLAWHERQVAEHLEAVASAAHRDGDAAERLAAALEAYALLIQDHMESELAALLHQGRHMDEAQRHLTSLVQGLVIEGAAAGNIRNDVPPDELTRFCLHALTAANGLESKAAVRRLVEVTMAALRTAGDASSGAGVASSDL
jgi:AcrR family transcriptional regulator